MAEALAEKEILPLPDHAEKTVVENHDFDGEIAAHGGRKLLHHHLNAAVARDVNHEFVGLSSLRADGRRKTEAHHAQPAGRNETARVAIQAIQRRPHLVLADFGGDNRLAFGQLGNRFDHLLRLNLAVNCLIRQRLFRFPRRNLRLPIGVIPALDDFIQLHQHVFDIADNRNIHLDCLADGGRINVNVNNRSVRRKHLQIAGHAVIETRADGDKQIAAGHGEVRVLRAVHAQHAEEARIIGRKRAQSHQR